MNLSHQLINTVFCFVCRVLKDALNKIAVDEEREQLQGHYSDIQQELQIKTEALKARRQKIRAQEREIQDLHSEFQLERADYLESIRKTEKDMRFYEQLLGRALPFLRKDNRFWDVDDIRVRSDWNDETEKWVFPEDSLRRVPLPPAVDNNYSQLYTGPCRKLAQSLPPSPKVDGESNETDRTDFLITKLRNGDNQTIVDSYFRPKRARELLMRYSNSSNGHNRSKMNILDKLMDTDLPGRTSHFSAFSVPKNM